MRVVYFQYFQYLGLLTALLYYRGLRAWSLGMMLPLLLFVCIIETLAANYRAFGMTTNVPFYNIYLAISPVFYFILFQKMLRLRNRHLRLYLLAVAATMIFVVYDYFFIEPGRVNVYTTVVTLIEQLVLSFMVLAMLVTDDSRPVQLVHEPYFWIAGAILLFTLVTIVIQGLQPYIYRSGLLLAGKPVYKVIMPIVNVVFYSCYTYAIYLCQKHRATFSPSS